MSTVGVIGAYGATGEPLVRELAERTDARLLLGGRREARAQDLAGRLGGSHRATRVDVFDRRSLDSFCADVDVVVNCAGPSQFVGDRVARAAVNAGRQVIDVGGSEEVFSELTSSWTEPERRGLSVIVDAGWIPGLSGVLAHEAVRTARESLRAPSRLEVYFGDRNVWSETGLIDAIELARLQPGRGTYERGAWHEVPPWRADRLFKRVELEQPYGKQAASLFFPGELATLAKRETDLGVAGYVVPMLSARGQAALLMALSLVRSRPQTAARILRAALRRDRDRGRAGGVVEARAFGAEGGVKLTVSVERNYWVTGLVGAVTTMMLLENAIEERGCRYLCDAVESRSLLERLSSSGVEWRKATEPGGPKA